MSCLNTPRSLSQATPRASERRRDATLPRKRQAFPIGRTADWSRHDRLECPFRAPDSSETKHELLSAAVDIHSIIGSLITPERIVLPSVPPVEP